MANTTQIAAILPYLLKPICYAMRESMGLELSEFMPSEQTQSEKQSETQSGTEDNEFLYPGKL